MNIKAVKRQEILKELLVLREITQQEIKIKKTIEKNEIQYDKKDIKKLKILNDDDDDLQERNETETNFLFIKRKAMDLKYLLMQNNRQTLDPEVSFNSNSHFPDHLYFCCFCTLTT